MLPRSQWSRYAEYPGLQTTPWQFFWGAKKGEMWMRAPSGPFEGCGQIWLGEGWLDDWRRLITVENCILTPLLHQRAPTNWLLTCKADQRRCWAAGESSQSGVRLLLIKRLLARGGGCRPDLPSPDLSKITAKCTSSLLWTNEVKLGKICVAHPNPSAVPESTRQFIATPKCQAHPHPHFLTSSSTQAVLAAWMLRGQTEIFPGAGRWPSGLTISN